ncbi:hypothetical protein SAMN04488128_103179 [Chitinophaga eiseniae]|uniref:Uncharacterized protein n=1 Tax=Chitinophaga eiseniae TaxID=634771 RepID=A0A1T4SNL5_9BACT|nr:hypothetical protein [Chitinophaga eiseniae]SKA29840.1 hypothetical protein SAMN04488128_103179 [Chitinophaga eiseniae]
MIKVTDLRINNLINYRGAEMYVYSLDRGGHTFFKINDIAINKETGCTIDGGEMVYSGIPITAEWLGRFGFIRGENVANRNVFYSTGAHKYIYAVYLDGEVSLRDVTSVCTEVFTGVKIEFVHQLQNMYFALVGEELQDVVNAK